MPTTGIESHKWWKEANIYQVYPSSFKDTNGEGWGDIRGIISKLDYLKELGVDIIWVSPIFKSPQVDMGYDISDYKAIDPIYGTLEDVDDLIDELKKRGMKLMMDLVVNHTSDQHAWFIESRSSLDNPKRDWYIWKPPRRAPDGSPLPPNNWASILGDAHSAWTYDEKTDQYYLSLFTPEQADLNWENPDVRAAVHDVMHFWLDRGACGYRMDVINMISKVQTFPDAEPVLGPDAKYHPGSKYYTNGPRMHEYIREINRKVLTPHDAVTVGEMPGVSDIDEIIRTVGSKSGELNMIFIFDITNIDHGEQGRFSLRHWTAKDISRIVTKWQHAMVKHDGWNSVFLENHDNPRSVTRYTDDSDSFRFYGAKLLALMQMTLSGTLFVYQGEEIGMRNVPRSWDPEVDYKDIESINFWRKQKERYPHNVKELEYAKTVLQRKARDHARTPMQWDDGPNAGFCDKGVTPWMRVNSDYAEVNAKRQKADEGEEEGQMSVFHFWQRGLQRRREFKDSFVYGDFDLVGEESEEVLAYTKSGEKDGKWLVVLNFSGKEVCWEMPTEVKVGAWEAGNYTKGKEAMAGKIPLRPWEALVGRCKD